MAIKVADEYVNTNPADSQYPGGSFKNASSPTATDGTPFEEKWANDMLGFFQALMAESGLTPSGVPDTAIASQYLQAVQRLCGTLPVATRTEIKLADTFANAITYMQGRDAIGDGGAGFFIWRTTASLSAAELAEIALDTEEGIWISATGGYWKRLFSGSMNAAWFGAKGDYDFATKTGTDDYLAISSAAAMLGGIGGQLDHNPGNYRLSQTLTVHEGVVLNGLATVGSVTQKGCNYVCDHTGDGVVFDGNNGGSTTEGTEEQIRNIWILKAPLKGGGDGLKFISTDTSNTPGWVRLSGCHIVGATQSQGEALWSRGLVVDGAQSSIGLKNITAVDCGVAGVSTDNKFIDILNGVEIHFDNMYVRDAVASFPSTGVCGITIDSDQGAVPAADAPSALIRISNSEILGNIVVGECASLYVSNSFATALLPTGVYGDGTNISFIGGELNDKYVDTVGYTVRIDTLNQKSRSDLSNQLRQVGNLNLGKSHSGIFVTSKDATGAQTYTLPEVGTTNIFDFTVVNNGAYEVNITKQAGDNFYPRGCNLNSNITDVVIPSGAAVKFTSDGDTAGTAINVECIKGIITLTGLGTMNSRNEVSRISTLSGSLLNRPREADVFALDCNGSDRVVSLNAASFDVGDRVTMLNTGSVGSILFGADSVLPGDSATYYFNGTDFGV